jgi:hypothetical protein
MLLPGAALNNRDLSVYAVSLTEKPQADVKSIQKMSFLMAQPRTAQLGNPPQHLSSPVYDKP